MPDPQKLKWWEGNVDEIFIGLFIACVGVGAILFLPEGGGKEVAIASVSGLAVYLGMKSNK